MKSAKHATHNPKSKTRTTRMPAFWGYPPPPHDYPYHWVILDTKSKDDKVKVKNLKNSPKLPFFSFWNKHYTQHTFWSCLIRCANLKWIQWVLLKIQRGHDSVHRRTDKQTDRWNQYTPFNFVEARGINMWLLRHPQWGHLKILKDPPTKLRVATMK